MQTKEEDANEISFTWNHVNLILSTGAYWKRFEKCFFLVNTAQWSGRSAPYDGAKQINLSKCGTNCDCCDWSIVDCIVRIAQLNQAMKWQYWFWHFCRCAALGNRQWQRRVFFLSITKHSFRAQTNEHTWAMTPDINCPMKWAKRRKAPNKKPPDRRPQLRRGVCNSDSLVRQKSWDIITSDH